MNSAINIEQLKVGEISPFPIYDCDGNLLLQKGKLIHNECQLKALLTKGVNYIATPLAKTSPIKTDGIELRQVYGEQLFDAINDIIYRLSDVFTGIIDNTPSACEALYGIARDLQCVYNADPDASVASIHIGHDHPYSLIHPIQKAILSNALCISLDMPHTQRLSIICAALTANISIIELQDKLQHQEQPLNPEQKSLIQSHPLDSVEILRKAGFIDNDMLMAIEQHHEALDGTGYPYQLSADHISTGAAILSVADRYCAMVTARSYRNPLCAHEALQSFITAQDKQIDETLTITCINELGIYPPGSFVNLVNGETAIVIKRGGHGNMTPTVSSFISPKGGLYIRPFKRDTAHKDYAITGYSDDNDYCTLTA